ncbi:sulfotransferase family protein [Ideonella livida]|uniref:Sulfotransferase n=1 Tax=Ideonella livida TaxID=2707176 RepID=A0A7C9TNH0_9BURK|nr:sulfotransferase [Ideonella livida]NDY93465.1 sulfotransferase [Ideonella livida]
MFFILGTPRSGTTLLAQCLNAHSQLAVPNETDFIIPMAFVLDRVKDPAVGRPMVADLICHSAQYRASLADYLTHEEVRALVAETPYQAWALLQAIYGAVARRAGKVLAGDKSPNDLNFLRMLVKVGGLPAQAKVIHLVRDIRNVMVSLRAWQGPSDQDDYFARYWCSHNLYVKALRERQPDTYHLVRYEDMVQDPAGTFSAVCAFLGHTLEEGMLLPEHRHPRYRKARHHQKLYEPISADRLDAWRTELPEGLAAHYERQAREGLEAFGYPLSGG